MKDPWLHQIDITVPGFLIGPTPAGTHLIELPDQRALEEEATFSNPAPEEEVTKLIEVIDSSEDSDENLELLISPFPQSPLLLPFLTYLLCKLAVVRSRPIYVKLWCSNTW